MRLRELNKAGFWLTTRRWNVAYWSPWAEWVPLSIRASRHCWGALAIDRIEAPDA